MLVGRASVPREAATPESGVDLRDCGAAGARWAAVSLPDPVRFSQISRFGPGTRRLSIPLGDRLILASGAEVATKNTGCSAINA